MNNRKVDANDSQLRDIIDNFNKENYERIYNENCILREEHDINDIDLLDENTKLKEIINKINLIIKGIPYGGNEDYYMGKIKEINDLLKEV